MTDTSENKCPDCLYMELRSETPKKSEGLKNIANLFSQNFNGDKPQEIPLKLTINFNEQWERNILGRFKFGLRGGELNLNLTNARMPYNSRELTGSLAITVEKERKIQESNKTQKSLNASITSLDNHNLSISNNQEIVGGKSDNFTTATFQITTKGSEVTPKWVFEAQQGEPILKGLLKYRKLGDVVIDKNISHCYLEAKFIVSQSDVFISNTEGIWPQNISTNKRAVLERTLIFWLLKEKLQPYISSQKLQLINQ